MAMETLDGRIQDLRGDATRWMCTSIVPAALGGYAFVTDQSGWMGAVAFALGVVMLGAGSLVRNSLVPILKILAEQSAGSPTSSEEGREA